MNITSKLAAASVGLLVISTGSAAYAQADLNLHGSAHASVQAQLHRPDFSLAGKAKQTSSACIRMTESDANRVRSRTEAVVSAKTSTAASVVHSAATYRPKTSSYVHVTSQVGSRTGMHGTTMAKPTPRKSVAPPRTADPDASTTAPASGGSQPSRGSGVSVTGSANVGVSASAGRSSTNPARGLAAKSGVELLVSILSSISAHL